MEYVAFLLGINVGKRVVKMADLKALMESLGHTEVRTYLASGNVRFTAAKTTSEALTKKLEAAYAKKFGFTVGVIVRTVGDLEKLMKANPFKGVEVTKNTRRYVTFVSGKAVEPLSLGSVTDEYEILKITKGEVFSVLELTADVNTPEVMKLLGQSYGKNITTRNWNTIEKILS